MNAVADPLFLTRDDPLVDLIANALPELKEAVRLLLRSADAVAADLSLESSTQTEMSILRHEARRIDYDLRHLLGLFKIERSNAGIESSVVDCQQLLAEVSAIHAPMLAQRKISFVTECTHAEEGYFDRDRVMGVLNAFVNNAYRHARTYVALTCEVRDGYTVFSLVDDGTGYAPKLHVVSPDLPARAGGHSANTSLSFYFARRIAAMHEHRGRRGRVVLSNGPFDVGGCLELWLP